MSLFSLNLRRATAVAGLTLLLAVASARAESAATTPAAAAGQSIDFSRDIQPILSENCYFCHGPDAAKRKAKLRMDVLDPKQGPFADRENGPALVPGHPEKSGAMVRILSDDADEKMPPPKSNRKVTPQQADLLKRWIEQGAKWGQHWSLVTPKRPALPDVNDAAWPRNAIDRFVLARLEREGLKSSLEASKEALIRRVALDLTGLPPTPEEVGAFLADESAQAYEKVVDRLLASPRYGERMVWEWLDAARYADTNGYQGDNSRTMWPWRDWAVRAMNENTPFDRFTIEQIAGDLLPAPSGAEGPALSPSKGSDAGQDDRLATAFLRNHMINGEGGRIAEENRVDYVMDQAETVATTWLGLTVGCARCHDHKYDPISQKDYYALFAFFNNTPVDGRGGSGQAAPVLDFATADNKAKLADLEAEVKDCGGKVEALEKDLFPRPDGKTAADSPAAAGVSGNIAAALKRPADKRSVDEYREFVNTFKDRNPPYADAVARLKKAIEARDAFNAAVPRVMVMQELPKPRDTFVLVKGAYDKPADKVTADVLHALPPLPDGVKKDRLALARWLVSPGHPLTARVAVNRYWQQFFGVGLVKTAEDFGAQGEKPSHPELLDWLAAEFRDGDGSGTKAWDVKALHRLIVTSATYRQSSKTTPALSERDPENRLLARGPRFRLTAHALRDQALAASGLLVEQVGGPPVRPYQPPGIWEEATFGKIAYKQDHGPALYRRSVYTFWRRIVAPTGFFDEASRQTCTVKPSRTNTPLHALTTLNDPTFVEAARVLAQRVMTQAAEPTPEARAVLAYRLVLCRRPTEKERKVLLAALDRLKGQYGANRPGALKLLAVGESPRDERLDPAEHAAYTALCLTILNLDEAVTKE